MKAIRGGTHKRPSLPTHPLYCPKYTLNLASNHHKWMLKIIEGEKMKVFSTHQLNNAMGSAFSIILCRENITMQGW